MKRKRNITTSFLLLLRKVGMLCKKPTPYKPTIRIQRSVDMDGESINHKDLMFAKNILSGIHSEGKDKKMCHYDFRTHTCRCGITIEKLKQNKNCPLSKGI